MFNMTKKAQCTNRFLACIGIIPHCVNARQNSYPGQTLNFVKPNPWQQSVQATQIIKETKEIRQSSQTLVVFVRFQVNNKLSAQFFKKKEAIYYLTQSNVFIASCVEFERSLARK